MYVNLTKGNDSISFVKGSGGSPQALNSYHSKRFKQLGRLMPLSLLAWHGYPFLWLTIIAKLHTVAIP